MSALTRREFLKASAAGLGVLVGAPVVSACGSRNEVPGPAGLETKNQPAVSKPVLQRYPQASSDLVLIRHNQVWQGESLSAEILRQMLDASIQKLTHIQEAAQAWKALFKPEDRVAIKVNSIQNGCTHIAMVMAVVERLKAAGIAGENITIYDRRTDELQSSGYPIDCRRPTQHSRFDVHTDR